MSGVPILVAALLACQAPQTRTPTTGAGVSLGLFASEPTYDYGHLVDEIAATGADSVLIAVPWRTPGVESARLVAGVPRSTVQRTLAQATDAGLGVSVMPLVVLEQRGTGEAWRGQLDPSDRQTFWANYATLLRSLALDAERVGAERLVVGSELNTLESDPAWFDRIDEVRGVFGGSVSYSANWDRYADVPFWEALDAVAITAYFPVVEADAWSDSLDTAERFATGIGRPLVVTEVGYPSIATAASQPWDETTGAAPDLVLQARLLDTAVTDLCTRDTPLFVWNWFGTGSEDEPSFTPRTRPAETVLRRAFSRCTVSHTNSTRGLQ